MPAAVRDGRATAILGLCAERRGRREGAALLQAADAVLAQIAERLRTMRVVAGQAAAPTRSDAERRALQDVFAACRREIDRFAEDACFNGAHLLRGGRRELCQARRTLRRRYVAESFGYRLHEHMGFEAFSFVADAPNLLAGDRIRVEYEAGLGRISVTNMTTGRRALATAPNRAPAIGSVETVEVPAFGLRILLNDGFLVARDNRAPLDNPGLNEFVLQADHDWISGAAVLDRAHFDLGRDGEDKPVVLESARLAEIDEALIHASIVTASAAADALPRAERACERVAEMRLCCARMRAALRDEPADGAATAETSSVPVAPANCAALRALTPRAVPALRRLLLVP
jgi:flagellin-like hook-associated protein FlgL